MRIRITNGGYDAEVLEHAGRHFYSALGVTIEITADEARMVVGNPRLHYVSTALKLHLLINRLKDSEAR